MALGKIEIHPIYKVFPHESKDFTRWMEDNIDALAERVGIKMKVIDREKVVGNFNVDLLCADEKGNMIVIENQLEHTDDTHFGKLLTYAINLKAETAIWIASDIKREHLAAIEWINDMTRKKLTFYFVKVEAVRIGDSPYAPLFTVLFQPDENAREMKAQKAEFSETQKQRYEFWDRLILKSRDRTFFEENQASHFDTISVEAGKRGISFNYGLASNYVSIGLYIDHDKESGEKNKLIFDTLYEEQGEIENEFGAALSWEKHEDKRASRIVYFIDGMGLDNYDRWDTLHEQMIELMLRFDNTFRKRIKWIDL